MLLVPLPPHIAPADGHPVLLVPSPLTLHLQLQPVLSLFALGVLTGTVVDCGAEGCRAVRLHMYCAVLRRADAGPESMIRVCAGGCTVTG